jgi:hypothetical protein
MPVYLIANVTVTDDAWVPGYAAKVHEIAANRLRESGLLDHPDIGEWLRTAVEKA